MICLKMNKVLGVNQKHDNSPEFLLFVKVVKPNIYFSRSQSTSLNHVELSDATFLLQTTGRF